MKFFTRWVLTEDLNFFSILTASLIIISTMMWDVGGSPDRVPLLVVVICPNYQLPFSIIQITLIGRNLHFQSKSASDLRFERNYNLPDPLYCLEQTRYPGNKKILSESCLSPESVRTIWQINVWLGRRWTDTAGLTRIFTIERNVTRQLPQHYSHIIKNEVLSLSMLD